MKKKAILSLVILFCLTSFVLGGELADELKKKGIHVADLSEQDKINLQINKLEQAIRQQNIGDVVRILSPDYSENNPSFNKNRLNEILERSFSNFAKTRAFATKTNKKTGWRVTATQDFYIRNAKMQINQNRVKVECDVGFFLASDHIAKETLTFSKVGSKWFLSESEHFFSLIENASVKVNDRGLFAIIVDDCPILSFTEEDIVSTHSLAPTLLYSYEGYVIPRMNMSMCQQLWGFRHGFIRPFGIVADVQYTPGGPDFTYEFLFITDAMANNIVASDQDEWLADYGEWGGGLGQFAGPHGICNLTSYYFVADMFNNRVITYRYEKGWDDPMWSFTLTAGFDWPIDVDAKRIELTEPPEDVTYIAVADYRNHRIVIFHGPPYPFGFDRAYGEYGSGQGQFIYPTSVCFGRDPETGWQTNDLFLTDNGNHRLVGLYIQEPEGVLWRGTYQFPTDAELTSVEVDNKGLVYVVDRHNAKVYKFAAHPSFCFELLGIWGERGTADGQLLYPNMLTVAHGRYCPYPNPCVPLNMADIMLGDVFVSESWGDQTGVRRFVIAADVVNLSATYIPYNESTGEGNFIWYSYHLTDFADVTERVYRGGEVCTTYNRGSLNWGSQGGDWNVGAHPHGETYTVKITATSIYDPATLVEKTVDVYVDTITTHNPIITRGIRCKYLEDPFASCNECWQCIKEGYSYTIDVEAFDPDGDSLTYEWRCDEGYFITEEGQWGQQVTTYETYVCYIAPPPPGGGKPPLYEVIRVYVRDPYGGDALDLVVMDLYLHSSEISCPCGDVNYDGVINSADIVFLVNYLYVPGSPPPDPLEKGDVNNDCVLNSADIVYLNNYLHVPGSPPPECAWICPSKESTQSF